MKKINDSLLYLLFSLITLFIGVVLGCIAYYSILSVEPEIKKLLADEKNVHASYQTAYIRLRDPQIFARYENFDQVSRSVRNIIKIFDKRIVTKEQFTKADKVYLEFLFVRRIMGSQLTRNTMIFFFVLSLIGWGFLGYERLQLKKTDRNEP